MADFGFDLFDLLTLEFDYLFKVLSNDMAVVRVVGLIRIVEFVILAEIHLADKAAFRQQRQCSVHRCARN